MIKQALAHLLCGFLTVVSVSALAKNDESYAKLLTELQQLISDHKFQQAYKISHIENQYLGEPAFDFLLGISALKTNQPATAVFAFERVVEASPQWYEARLHLVRAYLMVKNLPAADTQALILINAANTPKNIKTSAQSLLDAAIVEQQRAGRSYTQNIQLAFGVDDNVNAGTAEDTIIIPNLGEFLLSPDSKSTDDNYMQLNYRGSYSHPLDQQSLLTLSVNTAWYKFEALEQYDRVNTHINAAYKHKQDKLSWYVQAGVTPLILDGELYRTESSLVTGADFKLSKKSRLFGAVSFGVMNNKLDEKLDNTFIALNAGTSYVSQRWFQSVSINIKTENADVPAGKSNSRNILGMYYQANSQLAEHWQLLTLAGYQWIDYQDEHPLFLKDREDNLLMLTSTIRYLINDDLAIQLAANYQDKTSNISLFEYDRLDINLSVSYSF